MVYSPDDGQRNCPKRVEFNSKNKFEELVHLVGFSIRIYHDARSAERQKCARDVKSRLGLAKTSFNKNILFISIFNLI